MTKNNIPWTTFNQGIVSKLALARVEIQRLRFAAEQQENWTPRTLGPMSLRNGLGYIGNTKDNLRTIPIPFIFSHNDTAIIEFSNHQMTVRVNEQWIERNDVNAVIVNGDFSSPTDGWTLTATPGATISIVPNVGLFMEALALNSHCDATQAVAIDPTQFGMEHALRILTTTGPVGFRVGTAPGMDDLIKFTLLGVGSTNSLAFTPNSSPVYIRFETNVPYSVVVALCQFESSASNPMQLPIPYVNEDLDTVSYAQSGDVVYLAHKDYQQLKIERRSTRSWSICMYLPNDGPFQLVASDNVLISPSALEGDITLTSDVPFFSKNQENSLLRLFMNGQLIQESIGAQASFSDPIRISGVAGERTFAVSIDGTWSGTVTLQQSSDSASAGFTDVKTYTTNVNVAPYDVINDGFDNSIIWYRLGFKSGDYVSGLADFGMSYPNGGGHGIVRCRTWVDPFTMFAQVVVDLVNTTATRDWVEGDWSNKNGFPSCVALYQGRLWWFGQDRIWASVSDAFESFDDTVIGDAGPIDRSIGYGPVEVINWVLPLEFMLMGLQSSEAEIKSSALDAPLTPTNFAIHIAGTQGSIQTPAIMIDQTGVFIQASRRRVYKVAFSVQSSWSFELTDLTLLLPDLDSDFVQICVQRQPDTRIHCLRADGTVLIAAFEPIENVICWYKFSTPAAFGFIERMIIMPGDVEEKVYYYTRRIIAGETKRFLEKQAMDSECQGGIVNKQADTFFYVQNNPPSNTINDFGTFVLHGEEVVVWADGVDLGTFTIPSTTPPLSTIPPILTLPVPVSQVVFGLPYTAEFKSAKLAYSAQMGTALNQPKRINSIGVILNNTHAQGLEFGPSFDRMNNLPMVYQGKTVDPNLVFGAYDTAMVTLPGNWDTDSRLCLRATAPRPCTLLGASVAIQTHDTL